MRHLGEIRHNGPALQIFSQRDRQCRARLAKIGRLEHLAQHHHFRIRIWYFNTNCTTSRNWRDYANAGGAHRQREIIREHRNLPHLHTGRGFNFKLRHRWTGGAPHQLSFHFERAQRFHQLETGRVQFRDSRIHVAFGRRRQQIGWWQFVADGVVVRIAHGIKARVDRIGLRVALLPGAKATLVRNFNRGWRKFFDIVRPCSVFATFAFLACRARRFHCKRGLDARHLVVRRRESLRRCQR